MLFAEEMNSYFQHALGGNPSNSDMAAAPWKPPMQHSGGPPDHIGTGGVGYNDAGGSKLVTKWGHPVPVDMDTKNGHHQDGPMHAQATPFTPGLPGGGFMWNEPNCFQFPPQPQDHLQQLQQTEAKLAGLNLKANVFHPSMPPHQGPPGHFTPPVEMVNGQWGRAEINQTTPWNLEMNGMSDQAIPQQQPHRYRKWDQQQRDDGGGMGLFVGGGYGGPAPYGGGMHAYGGGGAGGPDRMMAGGGGSAFGPPQFGTGPSSRGGAGPPPQRWDAMGGSGPGSGGNKFGGVGAGGEITTQAGGPNGGGPQRGGAPAAGPTGLFTSGPPPPLHSMGMMPPRPHAGNHILGPMPPPPLLPLNPHGMTPGAPPFNVNQFVQNGSNIQPPGGLSDDSVWQDPNGDLRKWQRDTGTSIWGDPAKQTNIQIQRWQQFTADEVTAKSSLLTKDGEMVDAGWGELPPIGSSGGANNGTNGGKGGSNQFIVPHQSQHQPHSNKATAHGGHRSVQTGGGSGNSWGGQDGIVAGQGGWEQQQQQVAHQNPSGIHHGGAGLAGGGHNQFGQQQSATGATVPQPSGPGTFMLGPPSTGPSAQQQQQNSMFQPPSLLSSLIDPHSGASESAELQQAGQVQQRKTVSPPGGNGSAGSVTNPAGMTGAQQTLKVSLADELSSLGMGTLGSGPPMW